MEGFTVPDFSLEDLKYEDEDSTNFSNILKASEFPPSENDGQYSTDHNYSPDLQTNPSILSQLSPPGCLETEVRYTWT